MIGLEARTLTMDINVLTVINENISCNCTSGCPLLIIVFFNGNCGGDPHNIKNMLNGTK
jgi:hypothetical protein